MDAAVPRIVMAEIELLENVTNMGFDGVGRDPEAFADSAVGESFGHQREHFVFAVGELVERVGVAAAAEQGVDQLAVDDQLAGGDALERANELSASMTLSLRR